MCIRDRVVPAFAADTKTATNTTGTTQTQPTAPVKLTFDKLEETVRQNNVTIKANNNLSLIHISRAIRS